METPGSAILERLIHPLSIITLRESFWEIIDLLENSGLRFWLARDFVAQVLRGTIKDESNNHDVDFHIREQDKDSLASLLVANGYLITQTRYKLATCGLVDGRNIEFVFLLDIDPRSPYVVHCSRGIYYIAPKYLFSNHRVQIGHKWIPVPFPIHDYVRSSCASLLRSSVEWAENVIIDLGGPEEPHRIAENCD